jgi:hypothetical protein
VRPLGVVAGGKGVEEGLELGDGGGLARLGGQPFLEGLPEPLDLALGLGVAGLAVLLPDFQAAQLVLQAVAAADEPGRVDGPVVRQCGGRDAVLLAGSAERGQHDGAGDPDVGGQVQHVPGVVIQPAQDLGIGAGAAAGRVSR